MGVQIMGAWGVQAGCGHGSGVGVQMGSVCVQMGLMGGQWGAQEREGGAGGCANGAVQAGWQLWERVGVQMGAHGCANGCTQARGSLRVCKGEHAVLLQTTGRGCANGGGGHKRARGARGRAKGSRQVCQGEPGSSQARTAVRVCKRAAVSAQTAPHGAHRCRVTRLM